MKDKIQTHIHTHLQYLDEIREKNYNNQWGNRFMDLYIEQKQALKQLIKSIYADAEPTLDIQLKADIECMIDDAFTAHRHHR